MPELLLVVRGRRYSGWKSIRVTRTIESISGSFALEVSDRWGADEETWPIFEEDACRVEIDSTTVIDGYVDKRSLNLSAGSLSLTYTGKDRTASLVECSAIVEGAAVTGKPNSAKWTYRNIDLAEFARAIAKPFGVPVSVQPGLVLPKVAKLVVTPGDSCFEAIASAAARAGVLVVSDAAGGMLITRAGTTRTAALIQGQNVMEASVEYDASDRFRRYLISAQVPGTDEASGEATNVQAEATDLGVRRADRLILIRPDKGYSTADARKRADWEARIRAARAEKVSIKVQGWTQPGSNGLWPINAIAPVLVPRIGIRGDLLISQVEHTVDDGGGQVTQLSLVRPDAFTPEPKAVVREEGAWKELAKGA